VTGSDAITQVSYHSKYVVGEEKTTFEPPKMVMFQHFCNSSRFA
jgi:hypothetical protein